MTWHRLLPLLAMLALAVAPFGRMAAAEAMAPAHHGEMAAPGHCDDMPAPDGGDDTDKRLDCLTACASLAAVADAELAVVPASVMALESVAIADAPGLTPEAEPPPPRRS